MNCNNKFCYWNYDCMCCHESEDGYENATPNELDCPSSLRGDFESEFWAIFDMCHLIMKKLNTLDLLHFYAFIKSQRNEELKAKDIANNGLAEIDAFIYEECCKTLNKRNIKELSEVLFFGEKLKGGLT